jgi:hypothetical protein
LALKCYGAAAERYEQLRSQALHQQATGIGLGLFVQRGMAAWITVWGGYVPSKEMATRDNTTPSRSSFVPDAVIILASMALSCVKGEENAD